jgi:hypothetical protein
MKVCKTRDASIRIDPRNPNHHLYNNNGVWWVHYTIYPDEYTNRRVRRSLETSDIEQARQRRDLLFETLFPSGQRNSLEVYFYPNTSQNTRIENLALLWISQPVEHLVKAFNDIARTGLSDETIQWIKLCAIGRALEHHFKTNLVEQPGGRLSADCLIALQTNRTLIEYPFKENLV